MRIFKWLIFTSLATTILPILQAEPRCPGNVPSLRLETVGRSLIVVPVTINHTGPYDFLVDTGAQVTTVDPVLAAELNLKIEGTTGLVGVGYRIHPSFAHVDVLEAGSHAAENPVVVVQNLEKLQAADPQIRGILGGNFLERFDVLIDYMHRMLCLDDGKVMQAAVKGKHVALTKPAHRDGGVFTEPLIIPVHLSGVTARPLLQLLDSGANFPILYNSDREVAGGFFVHAPIRDRGPDGVERVFAVLPPQDMEIGTLAFHQISFVSLVGTEKDVPKVEVDGLLPTALFRRVYISYADRFVVLEPW
jgi:predicted aspartyl protease